MSATATDDDIIEVKLSKGSLAQLSKAMGGGGQAQGGKGGALAGLLKLGTKGTLLLGGIGIAIGGILSVVKGLAGSSPMLKQMMKLMNFGIMMIFRPIGDFIGFLLRPIIVLLLRNFIIPWYKDAMPVMIALGTFFGGTIAEGMKTFFANPSTAIADGLASQFMYMGYKMDRKYLESMANAYAEVQEKARQEAANPYGEKSTDAGKKAEIAILDPKKKKKESSGTETEISTQESTKFLIPEEIPTQERTAFHGAAAAASKAGKSHFMFKGKKYPATMQKDTAHAITSQTANESVIDEVSKKTLGSYIKKAAHDSAARAYDAGDLKDPKKAGAQIVKSISRGKGINRAVDKLMKKESTNEATKPTAQHKSDDKTRDTYEKQLSTRKGEKDFVDQHKAEMPKVADEPKIDAMNFQTFKTMTKKSKSRPGDNAKGDTNIIPSATPVKGK